MHTHCILYEKHYICTKTLTFTLMIKFKDGFHGERAIVLPQVIVNIMQDDPLLSALHITDIGYYPHAEHHYRERLQPIDQFVFIYCMDGAGHYKLNGQEYGVQANQYFILPAGLPHAYWADQAKPWTIYWIHFKGKLAKHYVSNNAGPINVTPEAHSRIGQRMELFEEMFNTLESGFSDDNLRYVSSAFHYYLGSLQYIQQYRNAWSGQDKANGVIGMVIHFMKENIEKRISVDDLAHKSGMSAAKLFVVFKEKTGHTPLAYLNLLKVQRACFMLDSTDMTVTQISFKVGIQDTSYFSRMFSKIMGMSPQAYRLSKKG